MLLVGRDGPGPCGGAGGRTDTTASGRQPKHPRLELEHRAKVKTVPNRQAGRVSAQKGGAGCGPLQLIHTYFHQG